MKLSKVNITNFRCFESLRIPFEKDLNVFVGANGSGKSSILDAIAIVLYDIVAANSGKDVGTRLAQGVQLWPKDIYVPNGSDEKKDFVHIHASATDFYELKNFASKTSSGEPVFLEWDQNIQYEPPDAFKYGSSKSNMRSYFKELWSEIRNTSDKAMIPLPVIAYYRSNRNSSNLPLRGTFYKYSDSRHFSYINALKAGIEDQATLQWLYSFEHQEMSEKIQKKDMYFEFPVLKAIKKALKQFLWNVDRFYFGKDALDFRILFSDNDEKQFFQLSDGYRNLLSIAIDFARRLAQANPAWDNPLEAPGILLIDEIELHLHPKWQQTVIPNLQKAFPNTQIIVTTHSPQVLTTVESRNITILKDFKLYASPVHTYGAESKRLMKDLMGTDSRPPDNEISNQILSLFRLINDDELEKASELCDRLFEKLGIDEPALVEAQTVIKNRQWEKELDI